MGVLVTSQSVLDKLYIKLWYSPFPSKEHRATEHIDVYSAFPKGTNQSITQFCTFKVATQHSSRFWTDSQQTWNSAQCAHCSSFSGNSSKFSSISCKFENDLNQRQCRQADQTKLSGPAEKALARGCVAWPAPSTLLGQSREELPQLHKTWQNVEKSHILSLFSMHWALHSAPWINFYPKICYRSRARILSKTPFYSWCVPPCRRC